MSGAQPELLAAAIDGLLSLRSDLSDTEWTFWEWRTLNVHRIVGLWMHPGIAKDASGVQDAARAAIAARFTCAWWRGLAFGVVIEAEDFSLPSEISVRWMDQRANSRGTWQWAIVVSKKRQHAQGSQYRSLRSTNIIENVNGAVAKFARNVRRWRDGQMIVRWVTTALREADKKFRKLKGYKDMPRLIAALDAHQSQLQVDTKRKAA